MAFQRSYSKVWWGSDNMGYSSLPYSGNLSRIQEVDDENSKLWRSHNSPGSLRSQDSGFSDNDESSPGSNSTSQTSSPSSKSISSPTSMNTVETPPTVIRRKSTMHSPVTVSRRISFSAPSSPVSARKTNNVEKSFHDSPSNLMNRIDRLSFVNCTPKSADDESESSPCKCPSSQKSFKDRSIRRRRAVNRKSRRTLIKSGYDTSEEGLSSLQDDDDEFDDEETILLGCTGLDMSNVSTTSTIFDKTPAKKSREFIGTTSTPNRSSFGTTLPYTFEYKNPLLNGHEIPVQYWIDDIRASYEQEVMSTLQTKSIAQEAFRNYQVTTNTVTKIIRQIQQNAINLQNDFDQMERIYDSHHLHAALSGSNELLGRIAEFMKSLERRSAYFIYDNRSDKRKFQEYMEQIETITKDTRLSLEKHHYISVESLNEDVQVLKRLILLAVRIAYEKLVGVLVQSIENAKCDLMLRANLNMIATLSNIEYQGFASLNEAFLKNETVRALLMVCLECKYSSVRAISLRALATVCCNLDAIQQFGETGGIDIIREILFASASGKVERSDPEKREAISLLTQLTAPWHGHNVRVIGLKDCVDAIIEGITEVVTKTNCCQTLLLCAAALNNLSRVETTSIYSIMANETIMKLRNTIEIRGPGVSIFLYEQVIGILYNMSGNKKCHSHLSNSHIIHFITHIFQSKFHETYPSRAENDSHRRTIKTILHILTRLIHDSSVGQEILENHFLPIFSKIDAKHSFSFTGSLNDKDLSFITKQMSETINQKLAASAASATGEGGSAANNKIKFNISRQESYV